MVEILFIYEWNKKNGRYPGRKSDECFILNALEILLVFKIAYVFVSKIIFLVYTILEEPVD